MDYEVIREARLRVPFRAFTLTFHSGWRVLVDEPTHLAIASNVLIVSDERGGQRLHHPRDVAALSYSQRSPSEDVQCWIEGDAFVKVKAVNRRGDAIDLTTAEARAIGERLIEFADRLEATPLLTGREGTDQGQ